VGLFDAGLRFAEDSDWYTRAAEAGLAVERLDQVTLLVRRHEANMNAWQDLPWALSRERSAHPVVG
jgi:hypothetical protein